MQKRFLKQRKMEAFLRISLIPEFQRINTHLLYIAKECPRGDLNPHGLAANGFKVRLKRVPLAVPANCNI